MANRARARKYRRKTLACADSKCTRRRREGRATPYGMCGDCTRALAVAMNRSGRTK